MADRRALLRKLENVEAFPLIALQALPELRADLDSVEAEALLRARELGASLEDIADALAITRQGVAYKLKVLAGNGEDHEGADESEVVEVAEDVDVAEVGEFVEVPDEPQSLDEAEDADEAEDEVIDVRAPHTEGRPDVDFRRPHTKA